MIIYPPHWTDLTRLEIETLKKFTAMPPVAVNVGVETGKGVQDWVRERGGGWGWGEGPGKGVHDCLCVRERERERARARYNDIIKISLHGGFIQEIYYTLYTKARTFEGGN